MKVINMCCWPEIWPAWDSKVQLAAKMHLVKTLSLGVLILITISTVKAFPRQPFKTFEQYRSNILMILVVDWIWFSCSQFYHLMHSVLARGFTKIANLDINRLKFIFWSSISIIAHWFCNFDWFWAWFDVFKTAGQSLNFQLF